MIFFRKVRLYFQRAVEFFGRLSKKNTVVLMFHHIYDDERAFDPYSISKTHYMDLMSCLMKEDCNFIDLKKITHIRNKRKNILITFDDAYDDVYENVFPFMKANKLPFTVFQTLEYIGKSGLLSEAMINELLHYDGFTLGSHSMTHNSPYELSEDVSDYEASESKVRLKKLFGQEIFAYAYPYGSLNHIKKANVLSVKNAKYSMAFSTIKTSLSLNRIMNNFLIPRVNVNDRNYKDILSKYIS